MKTPIDFFHRALLHLLPRDFRRRFGSEIAHHLRTGSREAWERGGLRRSLRFWIRTVVDLLRTAALERREQPFRKNRMNHTGFLTDLTLDTRYAVRGLLRSPGFSLVVLLTLALGIGATTAMFSVANAALGRGLPYPDPDRLVLGRATFSGNVNPWVSFPDYQDYRDQSESLESLATIGGGAAQVTLTGGDEPQQATLTFVTGNLFETLGVSPGWGSTFTIEEIPGEGAGQVVISHAFWQRWFGGSPDAVGRTLIVDGSTATVMGVMPQGFRFLYDTDIWAPPWPGASNPVNRRFHNWLLVGRLRPGVSLASTQSEIDLISTQLQEAYPESNKTKALQIDELQSALVEGYRESLFLLAGAIVLVLLIACSNVANLLLARGSTRASEIALRAAVGAGRFRLSRQLLVECLILALMAGSMGVVLAVWLQDLILGFVSMDRLGLESTGISGGMLGIGLALSLGTVLLFGIVPSLTTTRTNPAEELKNGTRGSTSGGGMRIRSGLVVFQVALSLVLLVSSGLLLRSFASLRGVDPGFRIDNLLTATISLPNDRYVQGEERIQFFQAYREAVQSLPRVQSVALVSQLPILQPSGNVAIWAPERPPETNTDAPWADARVILPGYFRTMEIPLIRGRSFEATDGAEAPPVIVLSRRTVELVFPDEDPIGKRVAVDVGEQEPAYFQVVGVVEDHQLSSLSGSRRPAMFFSFEQNPRSGMRIAVATEGDPTSLIRPLQERLWELDPDLVLGQPQTMQAAVDNSLSGTRAVTTVLGLFALVAVVLAALGLYGVLAFFVARRFHEIGIRVALGASTGKVLSLVFLRGLALVGAGLVLGVAGSLGASRLVESMLFQVSATDPTTYAGVTTLFLVLATATCAVPAWRALKVDPVEAFRAE